MAYAFPPISLVLNENQRNGGGARIGHHSVRVVLPAITQSRWNCRAVIGHSGGFFGGFSGPFRRRFGKSSGKPPKRGITSDSLSRAQTTTPNICPASAGGRSRRQKRDCLLFPHASKSIWHTTPQMLPIKEKGGHPIGCPPFSLNRKRR